MQTSSTVRKRLTLAQREKVLDTYRRSGLSQRDFTRKTGIGLSTLQLWLRKAAATPCAKSSASFIQVPNLLRQPVGAAPYRLHLPGEVSLEIGAGFVPEELASLLGTLCSR
jgi:hypothetical protein